MRTKRLIVIALVMAFVFTSLFTASRRAMAGGLEQSVVMTSHSLASLPDASCAALGIIVPTDSGQECAVLVNVGSNHARIGDSNCGAAQCADVAPGATVTLCTTAAIYCYSASGTTIAITKVQQ
jgi:hypothetical protein